MAQNNEYEKKKTVRLIVIGIVAAVIVLVTGMGAGVLLFGEPSETSRLARVIASDDEHATEITIPLDEFLVNVQGESARRQSIARMEITVTTLDDEAADIIASDIAKVRDAVIHVVSNQTTSTIMEENDGDFVIKDQIKDRINQSLGDELIENVYITNILIQN